RAAGDACHCPEAVKLDQRLRKIEINGAAAISFACENPGQMAHELEALGEGSVALPQRLIAFEHRIHVGIRHSLGTPDYAAAELVRYGFALPVDFDQSRYDEPVDLRI